MGALINGKSYDDMSDDELVQACCQFSADPFKNLLCGIYDKCNPGIEQKEDDKTYGLYDSLPIKRDN